MSAKKNIKELPAIHAIVVGIDKYPDIQNLGTAVKDARNIEAYLHLDKIKVPNDKKNITLLTNEKATKEIILREISSITKKANRNDPILFFFSGYAGRSGEEEDAEGILYPVDAFTEGGILESTLSQAFDDISKSCGNNITMLLDAQSADFNWNRLSSFVFVAPDKAKESNDGGAFTNAMLKVLGDESRSVNNMTVETFVGHIQAAMDGVTIRAVGVNVNRKLFENKGEKSHYAFIPCRTLTDGRIVLCAGEAQGVRVGTIYGIYLSNIDSPERLGQLQIHDLDNNGGMATFHDIGLNVPSFFYAVEEAHYFDKIPIHVKPTGALSKDYHGWEYCTEGKEAAMTVKVADHTVSLRWNGFEGQSNSKAAEPSFDVELDSRNKSDIQRRIRLAARFYSLVGAPPPAFSLISNCLKVRLSTADNPEGNLLGKDNFVGQKSITLELKEGDMLGPFTVTIVNENKHPVWPYIFICDPEDLSICPMYLPPVGLMNL